MNKKDICPACGINEKGIRAKTCRPCSVKALAAINRKAEETNNLLTKAIRKEHDDIDISETANVLTAKAAVTMRAVKTMHEEAGNSKQFFGPGTPELIGVDPAKPDSEQTVIVTKEPDKEPKISEYKPPRIGETTPDGKFYK